jgi:uncharacterized membrane protein YwaF
VLVFGRGLYPRRGDALRTFAATLAVAACAATADVLLHANYMYLAAKPAHGSLLSALGPWPWYLPALGGVALVMVLAVEWITRAVARRDPLASAQR